MTPVRCNTTTRAIRATTPATITRVSRLGALGPGASSSWPGWRGKDRSALTDETGLLKDWPKGGPKLLWAFEAAGSGYGQPAIVGDDLYILGKDDQGEFIKKLNLDGKELGRAKLDEGSNKYNTGWGAWPRDEESEPP